jgi:hypothetical protein
LRGTIIVPVFKVLAIHIEQEYEKIHTRLCGQSNEFGRRKEKQSWYLRIDIMCMYEKEHGQSQSAGIDHTSQTKTLRTEIRRVYNNVRDGLPAKKHRWLERENK